MWAYNIYKIIRNLTSRSVRLVSFEQDEHLVSSRLKMTAVSNDGKPLRHCKKNSVKAGAFSHFSLEDSARKWIAIDLQGVGETWIDPVNHGPRL